MVLLVAKILLVWSAMSVATGFSLGAAIGRGTQIHKEEFLSQLFACIEALQASQSLLTPALADQPLAAAACSISSRQLSIYQ
jgi:hypothetical protein